MKVQSFKDLMNGHNQAEIVNLIGDNVVRRLKVQDNQVEIDAITITLTVPLDTPITYEPWCFDRGSMLFSVPEFPTAKICTELDIVRYPDGTEASIEP